MSDALSSFLRGGSLSLLVATTILLATEPARAGWHYAWANGRCYGTPFPPGDIPPAPANPYWQPTLIGHCRDIREVVSKTPFPEKRLNLGAGPGARDPRGGDRFGVQPQTQPDQKHRQ